MRGHDEQLCTGKKKKKANTRCNEYMQNRLWSACRIFWHVLFSHNPWTNELLNETKYNAVKPNATICSVQYLVQQINGIMTQIFYYTITSASHSIVARQPPVVWIVPQGKEHYNIFGIVYNIFYIVYGILDITSASQVLRVTWHILSVNVGLQINANIS